MARRPETLKLKAKEQRVSPGRRGYDSDWKRIRKLHLADCPFCEDCRERGIAEAATEVDHILSVALGGTHESGNLRSLCKSCHSKKTVREDGGFGRGG